VPQVLPVAVLLLPCFAVALPLQRGHWCQTYEGDSQTLSQRCPSLPQARPTLVPPKGLVQRLHSPPWIAVVAACADDVSHVGLFLATFRQLEE